MPALSLRFFNVYGPRSRTSGTYGAVFGVFLSQKLAGEPYTVVGDGQQARDFTFVTDIAQAIVIAAKSKLSGQIYNVGSGETVSINRLVKLLGGEKVYIPKRPGEPDFTFADGRPIPYKYYYQAKKLNLSLYNAREFTARRRCRLQGSSLTQSATASSSSRSPSSRHSGTTRMQRTE